MYAPGPWTYNHPAPHIWNIRDANGSLIAVYHGANADENPQNEDTARLLAAAPELLAALEDCRQMLDNINGRPLLISYALSGHTTLDYDTEISEADAALAKARGHRHGTRPPRRHNVDH